MEWLPELVCQCARFLADGVPLPKSDVHTTPDGEATCATSCAGGGCPRFNCTTDSFITCAR